MKIEGLSKVKVKVVPNSRRVIDKKKIVGGNKLSNINSKLSK